MKEALYKYVGVNNNHDQYNNSPFPPCYRMMATDYSLLLLGPCVVPLGAGLGSLCCSVLHFRSLRTLLCPLGLALNSVTLERHHQIRLLFILDLVGSAATFICLPTEFLTPLLQVLNTANLAQDIRTSRPFMMLATRSSLSSFFFLW